MAQAWVQGPAFQRLGPRLGAGLAHLVVQRPLVQRLVVIVLDTRPHLQQLPSRDSVDGGVAAPDVEEWGLRRCLFGQPRVDRRVDGRVQVEQAFLVQPHAAACLGCQDGGKQAQQTRTHVAGT